MTDKPLGEDHLPGLLVKWPTNVMQETFAFVTSLPHDTPLERRLLLAIYESDCDHGDEWIGREFLISDYLCGPCTMVDDETGDEADGIRTLLLGPEHAPIAFVARSALEGIRKIAYAEGRPPPWDPPVRVRLKQVSGKKGRRYYKFIPVADTN